MAVLGGVSQGLAVACVRYLAEWVSEGAARGRCLKGFRGWQRRALLCRGGEQQICSVLATRHTSRSCMGLDMRGSVDGVRSRGGRGKGSLAL